MLSRASAENFQGGRGATKKKIEKQKLPNNSTIKLLPGERGDNGKKAEK